MSDTELEKKKRIRDGVAMMEELAEYAERKGRTSLVATARRGADFFRAWIEVLNERDATPMSDNDEGD